MFDLIDERQYPPLAYMPATVSPSQVLLLNILLVAPSFAHTFCFLMQLPCGPGQQVLIAQNWSASQSELELHFLPHGVLPTMQAPVLSAVATHAHWLLAPQETKAPHLEAAHLATTGATGVLHWPALQV